jgi:large subunit ribosomal protein L20
MRVKGGNKRLLRRKKILELAKGFKGKRRTCFRIAKERVMHALRNAYISRKLRKRDFRRLWNIRINAAARGARVAILSLHQRLGQGGREAQSQDARRDRYPRSEDVRRACRKG